jgi:hypothetical protein
MFDSIATATVENWNVVDGDVFRHEGREYRATSDAEFVGSQGVHVVRAVDANDNIKFIELTESHYDVSYVAEYAAS